MIVSQSLPKKLFFFSCLASKYFSCQNNKEKKSRNFGAFFQGEGGGKKVIFVVNMLCKVTLRLRHGL